MKIVVRVELITDWGEERSVEVGRIDRPSQTVNQVLNHRMYKRQQMRWTPRGAHLLAQVRCAVINGDLSATLRERKSQSAEPIPESIARFLEELQRMAA